MGLVCRGVTHCSECGTPLEMNEFGTCNSCEEELKKKKQNKEKANMSKIYKGYELIKEIAEGNIEDGTRFVIKGGEFNDFCATYENEEIVVSMFGKKIKLTTRYLINNCTFELIEDEIAIQDIEELEEFELDEFIKMDKSERFDRTMIEYNKINKLIRAMKQLDKKINNT